MKIYCALFLFSTYNGLCAMKNDIPVVQLPSQQQIASRLNALKLQDFVTKTGIDYTLGDQKENALSTDCAVACSLYAYTNAPSTKQLNIALAHQKKPEIIAAILKDHPDAIQYIKKAEENAAEKMSELQTNLKKNS